MSENDSQKGHERCGAKTRSGGECKLPAGHGTEHVGIGRCRRHGGSTPNHVKAANKIKATAAVEQYALPREIDPHQALIEELNRTAGWVAFLNERVQELDNADSMRTRKGGGNGAIPEETPHLWIQMLKDERAHFVNVAKTCIAVGIEERRVNLAEQQAELWAGVIRGIVGDLGHDPSDPKVAQVVRLRLMQGGANADAA